MCRRFARLSDYIAHVLKQPQAKSLQFLDLSQNAMDKKSVEYIAGALAQMPEQGLASLKLDDCQLKPLSLEALGKILYQSYTHVN